AQIGEAKPGQYFVHAFGPAWQVGLVGLVAGKLSQEYYRPALVMCQVGDKISGSGRSAVETFNLAEALTACEQHLLSYGGHKGAAGFSLKKENLEPFMHAFAGVAERELSKADLEPTLQLDAKLNLTQADWDLYEQVELLEPVGQGNSGARFASYNLIVTGLQPVGSAGQHLRVILEGDGVERRFIWFRQAERGIHLVVGEQVDVAYEVGLNEWNGNRSLELKVIDLRKSKSNSEG
ncbi:MAG: DHHA1 domain-containing protein, partial [Candidatus Veblenbacteria bacterium]|nr:DHHA1 domain-containing protein [Candidatus Veblenbacteria bacterium]